MIEYLSSPNVKPVLKLFLSFLVKNEIYDYFFQGLAISQKSSWVNRYHRRKCQEPKELVCSAFDWDIFNSSGYNFMFWADIDYEWRELLKRETKIKYGKKTKKNY